MTIDRIPDIDVMKSHLYLSFGKNHQDRFFTPRWSSLTTSPHHVALRHLVSNLFRQLGVFLRGVGLVTWQQTGSVTLHWSDLFWPSQLLVVTIHIFFWSLVFSLISELVEPDFVEIKAAKRIPKRSQKFVCPVSLILPPYRNHSTKGHVIACAIPPK